jgi:hypothetical protein
MTKIWTATCAAICVAFAVGLVAQAPQGSSSSKTITVTGCVARAPQSPTGTSGTTGAATAEQAKFLLTSAQMSPTGTSGAAAAAEPRTAVASQYRLEGDDAKLTPQIGHKVEIAGTVQEAAAASAPAAGASGAASAAAQASEPTVKVDTVKMIASTCQ